MRHLVINPRAERFARQQSGMEDVLAISWRLSVIVLGLIGLTFALEAGQEVLAPLFLAVVIGLMFGPLADRLEVTSSPHSIHSSFFENAKTGLWSDGAQYTPSSSRNIVPPIPYTRSMKPGTWLEPSMVFRSIFASV